MLIKIKYPLILKYWTINFLNKINLLPFNLNIKFYIRKLILNIYVYINQTNKNLINYNISLIKLKLKIIQLFLQQKLQLFFKTKLKVYFKDIFNQLSYINKKQSYYIYNYLKNQIKFKFNILNLVNVINISFSFKTPYILVRCLFNIFLKLKHQRNLIFLLKKLIKEFSQLYINLKGLKLKISGKINGVSRTKNLTILIGTISDSSKSFNNFYAFINSITFTGIFGIKLWLSY